MVTEQEPVPEQAPLQPANAEPEPGVAASVTAAPLRKPAVQVPELQLMPVGLLLTIPLPFPATLTVSV